MTNKHDSLILEEASLKQQLDRSNTIALPPEQMASDLLRGGPSAVTLSIARKGGSNGNKDEQTNDLSIQT